MRLIIEIPEEEYKHVWCEGHIGSLGNISNYITKGKPLPKGHGRLIDADALFEKFEETGWANNMDRDFVAEEILLDAPTIIEADKEDD